MGRKLGLERKLITVIETKLKGENVSKMLYANIGIYILRRWCRGNERFIVKTTRRNGNYAWIVKMMGNVVVVVVFEGLVGIV